jgi:hypothetical protein
MAIRDVPLSTITDLHTRFLCPFFLRRDCVNDAAKALQDTYLAGRDSRPLAVWECTEPHDLYREEGLDHVVAFLFSTTDTAGCRYLKLSGAAGSRWFGHVVAQLPGDVTVPMRLVPAAGIELFLSSYGVGLLAIALAPEREALPIPEAIEFNYRLSQLRWRNVGAFHLPHPQEDPQRWEGIPAAARQEIPPAPAPDAPLAERLGHPGGTFTPGELVEELLRPLAAFELQQVQERLSVYTVARFGAAVDFEHPEVRATYAPLLSALAQVEEASHAGAPSDTLGVMHALLNRRHWAGVSLLGAAHLIADQAPPEHPFNDARMSRIFLKYFVPYLASMLQRHALHRIVDEAATLVLAPPQNLAAGLAALRAYLLAFAAGGHFTQVSTREALHRYYRLCQEGLDTPRALTDARQALADLDAQYTTARQVRVAEDMAQNVAATKDMQERMQGLQQNMTDHLHTVAHVQVMVEWIEIFLVSVYAAHLWEMVATHVDVLHPWVPWGALGWAALGGGITALVLKPWRHRQHHAEDDATLDQSH